MAYKQLGPGVSQNPQSVVPGAGSFTAEDHSWEGIVFQFDQPVIDWELNLQNEIGAAYGLGQHVRQTMPSGFLSGDFYESPAVGSSFQFPVSANAFMVAAADLVVNGWPIRFEYSDTSTAGWNTIQLPSPPASGTETNVVILEVWRALVSPGSGANKSLSGQILRHGNAKAPDSAGNRNLADDLVDPTYAAATQARVQIQYRYRVIPSWYLSAYPEAPDTVVANTVPYLGGSGVDGAASTYSYDRVDGDPGLWRAGSGDATSAADLGTVDGYIYAVPICAVFRRNSDGFNRITNLNGGVLIASGLSDRPDGLFADQIVAADVKDLRKGLASNFQEVLDRNVSYLLQNQLATEEETTPDSCAGTSVFVRDEIVSGVRTPDAVRQKFSDRATVETVVCQVRITSPYASCDIDMNAVPVVWMAPTTADLTSLAPPGTSILEVRKVRLRVAVAGQEVDGFDPANGLIWVNTIDLTSSHVTLYFNSTVPSGDVYACIELAIGYPRGSGLSRTPAVGGSRAVWVVSSLASIIDSSVLSPTPDATRLLLSSSAWSMDEDHREISISLPMPSTSESIFASPTGDYLMLPNRLHGSVTINDGINPAYSTTNYTENTTYTRIELSYTIPGNTIVGVTYTQLIPVPLLGALPNPGCDVFYSSRATQSVEVPAGSQNIRLRLRAAYPDILLNTGGSGSPDSTAWPMTGTSQIPIATGLSDSEICAPVSVNLPNTAPDASGIAGVSAKMAYLKNGEATVRNMGDATQDADGRNFWPRVGASDVAEFRGSVDMASDAPHRTVFPALMEVVSASSGAILAFRPGTLVLALFTSIGIDSRSAVSVLPTTGAGCVALYRVRGNLMNPRRLTA